MKIFIKNFVIGLIMGILVSAVLIIPMMQSF